MNTLVIYYSFSGHTQAFAQKLALQEQADLLEIREAKKRSAMSAYLSGCLRAMGCKAVPIADPQCDFDRYDRFIICCPIWAGFPAPAFHAVTALLPEQKRAELYLLSASGESRAKDKILQLLKNRNITDVTYTDVKA